MPPATSRADPTSSRLRAADDMPVASLNGLGVNYQRSGPEGRRLLFLNGSGSTLAGSALLLAPFIERFDVLAADARGIGETALPTEPSTMSDYASDAIALLDHVGWESSRVVGISFGGMIAQELAVTHPDRIERLALLCTSPGGEGGSSYPLDELADLDPQDRASRSLQLLDARFTSEWLADHPGDQAIVDVLIARATAPHSDEAQRGEAMEMAARRGHDVWDRLHRITCPTLVASGTYDGIAPPANGSAIASRIPGAAFQTYRGGHAFFAQDPAAFPDILDFLAGP